MRLYKISYNTEQWSIKGSRDYGYKLTNKATLDSYFLPCGVIGLEQLSHDTFLVHHCISRNESLICRIRFSQLCNDSILEYQHSFEDFHFFTEDILLFDKNHQAILYSISKNCEIDTLNHMIHNNASIHDASFFSKRKIKLLYDTDDDEYPSYLLVEYMPNHTYRSSEYLQVIFDVHSLKPLSPVYSTLRNQYLTLTESYTLQKIMEEENYYLSVIDNFLYSLYYKDNRKIADELLSMLETK